MCRLFLEALMRSGPLYTSEAECEKRAADKEVRREGQKARGLAGKIEKECSTRALAACT